MAQSDSRNQPAHAAQVPAITVNAKHAIASLVLDTERSLGAPATIGIGTPGSMSSATGLLRGSNSVCLNGKPLQRDLDSACRWGPGAGAVDNGRAIVHEPSLESGRQSDCISVRAACTR